ncbi:S-adenosyl-L-methionine-dependent methyltransferase [Pleurotus eryngii]|uniref:S-adenosyl-L-methionine-dependent methyltransferase n=1 Tax=Pleurotus eryngii TaxID=5323 RepID=A0A9P6D5J8_PLEER|nr:S-adenosyl-L-methionine-dependent methyltransferase [Pleurotus eryngii]
MVESHSSQAPVSNPAFVPDASGWSAARYNQVASFVYSSAFTSPVLELLAPQPGEWIVDFGCGSGELTLELKKTVGRDGRVVGVDFSSSMIDKAKHGGLEHAFVADIQTPADLPEALLASANQFDVVFSNAALHWCKRDPMGVVLSVKRMLKPSGRFVGEMGGLMNCVGVRSALHIALRRRNYDPVSMDPWYFPSVHDYQTLLSSAGFKVVHISLNPRYTPLPAGLGAWLELFVRHSFLRELGDEEAKEVINEVVESCAVDSRDAQGKWALMYMRLRFHAVLSVL